MWRWIWTWALGLGIAFLLYLALLAFLHQGFDSPDRGPGEETPDPAIELPAEGEDPTLVGRTPEPEPAPLHGTIPPPVDLDAVDRERDLHGVVVREDGTPVKGAFVQVVTHPWRQQDILTDGRHEEVVEGPSTISAEDGSFSIRLERGALVALRVRAVGLTWVEMHLHQAGERVRVVLHEPARIRVVVKGPDEKPVPEVTVRIFHRGGTGRPANGVTDAEGTVVFGELDPGRFLFIDVLPTATFGHPGWSRTTTPPAGEEETVEIVLGEGRTLTGIVTDAATKEPIPRARVGMNWVLRPEVTTDAKGRYVLPGWTGGGVRDIHVLAEGYARKAIVVGPENVIDVALDVGRVVTGRVVDEDGRAIPRAMVSAVASDRGSVLSMDAGWTGDDGRFRLQGLTAGRMHTLVAVAPGCGRRWVGVVANEEDVDLGDVVLAPGLWISGVVVDGDGVPAARVPLELAREQENRTFRRGVTLDRTTDDLGRFFFPDLAPGGTTAKDRTAISLLDSELESAKVPDAWTPIW